MGTLDRPGTSSCTDGTRILQWSTDPHRREAGKPAGADRQTDSARRRQGLTEYADGLSGYNWSHWATFTWRPRKELADNGADRLVRKYDGVKSPRTVSLDQVDPISMPAIRRAMGRWCYRIKPSAIWWATEPGGRFGRHHIHALMHLTERAQDREPWLLAFRWFGRSEVEAYDSDKGAAHYVSKYVTKELSDFDFWTRRHGYRS